MYKRTALFRHLRSLGACASGIDWIGERTPAQAWEECERVDWLLWWAAKANPDSGPRIILAMCACVRMALVHVPSGEDRPRLAIEEAESYIAKLDEESHARLAIATKAASDCMWGSYRSLGSNTASAYFNAASAAMWAARAASYGFSASHIATASMAASLAVDYATRTGVPAEDLCREVRSRCSLPYVRRVRKEAQP